MNSDSHGVRRILVVADRGVDSPPTVPAHAAIHNLAGIGRPQQRDVDISARDADAFHSDYRVNPNADDPNVVVRVVDHLIDGDDQFMPSIVAVLDLLDAADTRAAAEALRVVR